MNWRFSSVPSLSATALACVTIAASAGCGGGESHAYATVHHEANRPSIVVRAVSPLVGLAPPPAGEATFDGKVAERLDVGPYAYLAVEDTDGTSRWAVTLGLDAPAVGDRVHVKSFGMKEPFVSRRLGRTFDRLHFATVKRLNAPTDARAHLPVDALATY